MAFTKDDHYNREKNGQERKTKQQSKAVLLFPSGELTSEIAFKFYLKINNYYFLRWTELQPSNEDSR